MSSLDASNKQFSNTPEGKFQDQDSDPINVNKQKNYQKLFDQK